AAGVTENSGSGRDFTVMKFSGVDGANIWSQVLGVDGSDAANAVTVDRSGDVIAAGSISRPLASPIGFGVVKFSGVDGAELWRQLISTPFGSANAVAVDWAGDVVAAGVTRTIVLDDDFTVIKFSGIDGSELWRQVINGSAANSLDQALAITVDSAGDVIAAGLTDYTGTGLAFTVIKFSGLNGAEL